MIKLDLKKYVDNAHISINALSKATTISRPTLTNMYNGKATGMQFETLDILCTFFNIGIPDLLKRDISIDNFQYIELSNIYLNTNEHRIVGIQYERSIKEKKDYEVAVFLISFDKKNTDLFNTKQEESDSVANKGSLRAGSNKQVSSDEQKIINQANATMEHLEKSQRLFFSLEWINPQEINNIKKNMDSNVLKDLEKSNMLMNYGETIALYQSFSKSLLSEVNFRIIANFISNSDISIDKSKHYLVSSDWNLGTESIMDSQKYHFEFSLNNGLAISLDSENDGISQQLEFEHTKLSPEIKKTLYPNLSSLE